MPKQWQGLLFIGIVVYGFSFACQANNKVTFTYIGPESGAAYAGVKQGLLEANLQGQFLGWQLCTQYDVP